MEQKKYQNPELEVVKYQTEDVLNDSLSGKPDPNKPIVTPPDFDG